MRDDRHVISDERERGRQREIESKGKGMEGERDAGRKGGRE